MSLLYLLVTSQVIRRRFRSKLDKVQVEPKWSQSVPRILLGTPMLCWDDLRVLVAERLGGGGLVDKAGLFPSTPLPPHPLITTTTTTLLCQQGQPLGPHLPTLLPSPLLADVLSILSSLGRIPPTPSNLPTSSRGILFVIPWRLLPTPGLNTTATISLISRTTGSNHTHPLMMYASGWTLIVRGTTCSRTFSWMTCMFLLLNYFLVITHQHEQCPSE